MIAVVLLAVVHADDAAGVFAVAAVTLVLALVLIAIALLRLRRVRQWPCALAGVSIATTGSGMAQRVRAVVAQRDGDTSWRCTNVLGVETRYSFSGEALVGIAPDGHRGLVVSGTRTRLLSDPQHGPA